MSNAKHTPGPWKHIEEDGHNRIVGPDNEPLFMVGSYGQFGRNGPLPIRKTHISSICEEAANARLIAAAPELLEACQRLIGSLGVMIGDPDNDGDIVFARAAIEKAKGE